MVDIDPREGRPYDIGRRARDHASLHSQTQFGIEVDTYDWNHSGWEQRREALKPNQKGLANIMSTWGGAQLEFAMSLM